MFVVLLEILVILTFICNFKLKNRYGKKTIDAWETHVDKLTAVVDVINAMGYILGIEFANEWYINKRCQFTLVLILFTSWVWFYSLYVEYQTLNALVLIGGLAFILTVRFTTIIFKLINILYFIVCTKV